MSVPHGCMLTIHQAGRLRQCGAIRDRPCPGMGRTGKRGLTGVSFAAGMGKRVS
ncbi:MAG TPA: hypothetical protein PLO53_10100 [Candidatus Hydrogenedentes bacterium]|nr:hypothetical protein [Candidatus Hydrogenedentota bacterium]